MRTISLFVLLVLAAPSLADPAKVELDKLQGGWKLATFEAEGQEQNFPDFTVVWFIKDNKVYYGGVELAELTIDPRPTPKLVDLAFRDPKRALEGIYALENDTLKVCMNQRTEGGKERPQEFTTKDKADLRLLIFKRDETAKLASTEGLGGYIGIMIRLDPDSKLVVIDDAFEGSPAAKAGLKKDDVLLRVASVDAPDLRTVVGLIRRVKPGSELAVRIKRDGKEQDITIKAGVLPFHFLG